MLKFFILTICLINALPVCARMEARWLSVASFVLDDGKTQVLFDPAFTRPGLRHWLNLSKFKSDEPLVRRTIDAYNLRKIDAIFVSHSHFDHSVDAATVARETKALFYVDESTDRMARASGVPVSQRQRIRSGGTVAVGDFRITPIRRDHPAIKQLDVDFLPGPVPEEFDFDFYDYRVGDTWFYYIEHPAGNILMDQTSTPRLELLPSHAKPDILIHGIANRSSDEIIVEGYVQKFRPRLFVANHFDNFFFAFEPESPTMFLPSLRMGELLDKLKKAIPGSRIVLPKFNEKIVLKN